MHSTPKPTANAGNRTALGRLNLPYIHVLVIILIALACYSNTFHVPFILDDEGSIQLHTPVHGLANYFKDGWVGYHFLPNRAVGYLTFALNYEFGELNVAGYHLVNLAIHTFTALLVYSLVRQTFRTPFMKISRVSPNQSQLLAFVVALLFVSHPIQTQAVTYIIQRLTSMTTMFYVASLVCYVRWRLQTYQGTAPASEGAAWYILSFVSIILAMKTKEISFTLPVVILLYECSFFGLPRWQLLAKISPLLTTLLLIPVTRILHVAPTLDYSAGVGAFVSDMHLPSYNVIRFTRWDYLFTQFNVIVTYLRLLIFPVNQNLDYDYPISHSPFEPRTFLSFLLLMTLFLLALFLYAKSRRPMAETVPDRDAADRGTRIASGLLRLAAFGILWFFITLSVESSIIKIQDVIYEHRVYLPSYGFFLSVTSLVTLGVTRLTGRFQWLRQITFTITACIIMVLSLAAYSRNGVWRDWTTLWSDNVAKSPNKPRPNNILGIGYFYRGDFDKAMLQYQEALRLKPDYIEVYYNMGLIHKARKEHKESILMFLKALGITAFNEEQHAKMYNEIGINYAELGQAEQALQAFATAVKYQPDNAEYRNNYGFALARSGKLDEALKQYQETLRISPGDSYALKAIMELRLLQERNQS